MHKYPQSIEPTATVDGEFTDGNPVAGLSPTVLRSFWTNMVQRELLSVLGAAGITPDINNEHQLADSINKLLGVLSSALADHVNDKDPHGATTAATASRLIIRDAAGRAQIGNPAALKDIANREYVDSKIGVLAASPIGQIIQGPFNNAPSGWLILGGGLFSRATYPDLWTFINAHYRTVSDVYRATYPGCFTTGNGYSTFRLPDMSGLFVRGVGGNSGAMGELQEHMLASHHHEVGGMVRINGIGSVDYGGDHDLGGREQTSDTGGIETRPINVAWRWLIRAQ